MSRLRFAILSLATVVLLNDLGASAAVSQIASLTPVFGFQLDPNSGDRIASRKQAGRAETEYVRDSRLLGVRRPGGALARGGQGQTLLFECYLSNCSAGHDGPKRCQATALQGVVAPEPASLTAVRAYLAHRMPALERVPVTETRRCQYETLRTATSSSTGTLSSKMCGWWAVGSGHGFKHRRAVRRAYRGVTLLAEANHRQRERIPFAGVWYVHQLQVSIGICVRVLKLIAKIANPEDVADRVEYLPLLTMPGRRFALCYSHVLDRR